ncbi:MAG: phosphate butyryltransferase [Candidatus Zixiibacteriota bacterium]|nr:MAG: phosphate butyryltransferase [candidate division Zixibacteria bacterium]
MTPEMQIPEVHSYDAVLQRAKTKSAQKKPRAALLELSAPDALTALMRAVSEGLVEPVLIGSQSKLEKACADCSIDIPDTKIIDTDNDSDAVRTVAGMATDGEIDMIVQGSVPSEQTLAMLLQKEQNFCLPGKVVSHVGVLKPERYPKLLMITDGAVVAQPDLKAKLGLISNLVRVSESIGINNPRVAVVGAVEVVYPQMPATVEGAVLAKMAERHQIKGALVDGPLSFDVAVDMFAAHSKGITTSEVAGQADAMLTSCIEVASGIYHAMALYGNCEIGGVVIGGRVPVATNAYSDSVDARFNSIVLGILASC